MKNIKTTNDVNHAELINGYDKCIYFPEVSNHNYTRSTICSHKFNDHAHLSKARCTLTCLNQLSL